MLIKYIRTPITYKAEIQVENGVPKAVLIPRGGDPCGVVVSLKNGNVGWSLCSSKDKYSKKIGLKIAISRAEFYNNSNYSLQDIVSNSPIEIQDYIIAMYNRSMKYFKS